MVKIIKQGSIKPQGVIRTRVSPLGIGRLEGSGNGKFCAEESAKLLENMGTILKEELKPEYYQTGGFSEEMVKNG